MSEEEEEPRAEEEAESSPGAQTDRPRRGAYSSRPAFKPPASESNLMPAGLAVGVAVAIALGYGAADLLGRKRAPAAAAEGQRAAAASPALQNLLKAAGARPGPASLEAPPAPLEPAPAAPPTEAPKAIPEPPRAYRPAPSAYYVNVNWTVRVDRDEPEMSRGGRPVMRLFSESIEGYPVVGDEVEVIVDGRPDKVPRERAVGLKGATKAVVMLPKDGAPHTVVFLEVYDLGPGGLVQVRETRESDGRGGSTYTLESPVDSVSWGSAPGKDSGPGRLKLKD